jgi:hypothetical protein
MRPNWQGGQFFARRTRGLTGGGAHGVTRHIACRLDNPKKVAIMFPGHMLISGNMSEWWRWKELKVQAGLATKLDRPSGILAPGRDVLAIGSSISSKVF